MKKQKTGGEWLDYFQSRVRNYCEKHQIAVIHRVMLLSILIKAWNKAFELGYMEKQKELDKTNQLVQAQKKYTEFLYNWIDKRVEYLRIHGVNATAEEFKAGDYLREKIEEIESSLLPENPQRSNTSNRLRIANLK